MAARLLDPLLRLPERRAQRRFRERAQAVAALAPSLSELPEEELSRRYRALRAQAAAQGVSSQAREQALALGREAARRALGQQAYPVQLEAALVLCSGAIAEMKTGEGKTLAGALALACLALEGRSLHAVTANDYLARRDCEWMRPLYALLGLEVGYLAPELSAAERKAAYACDVTYGTAAEFGFDYLRDNMAASLEEVVQRERFCALVDEADSVLLDEAKTPLVIAGEPVAAGPEFGLFAALARRLRGAPAGDGSSDADYLYDEKERTVEPLATAIAAAERALGVDNLYAPEQRRLVNHLIQALRAEALFHRDRDYLVLDGEIRLIDERTGRVLVGRRFGEGLHEALEAKEGLPVEPEHPIEATVSIQAYFRGYERLCGMTGTAKRDERELEAIYGLPVYEIPTNLPVVRSDEPDLVFARAQDRLDAIVAEVRAAHERGQPVLLGTASVAASEELAAALAREGLRYSLLNAKEHAREAEIIAQAGQAGAITVATNMAGRGVDIRLSEAARAAGGLYVIGCGRHTSRRVDDQLRGRSGRQGDPGRSRFYLSCDDELLRVFGGERLRALLERLPLEPGAPLQSKLLTRRIEAAQRTAEELAFLARRGVLEFDQVVDRQRRAVYAERRRVLAGDDLHPEIERWACELVAARCERARAEGGDDALLERLGLAPEAAPETVAARVTDRFQELEDELGGELVRRLERYLLLSALDRGWREQLHHLDELRAGAGLRALAGRSVVAEYARDAGELFEGFVARLREHVVLPLLGMQIDESVRAAAERFQREGLDPSLRLEWGRRAAV